MKKIIISTICCLCFATSMLFAQTTYTYSGGTGTTEQDPYLISSKADLDDLSHDIREGLYFLLVQNLTGITTPIGGDFRGTFDGGGHTIDVNMNILDPLTHYAGVFGGIVGATIKNLGVTGSIISTGPYNVGGICGFASSSTISNCFNMATISTTYLSAVSGGICGYAGGSTTIISNCYSTGNISASSSIGEDSYEYINAGGICGGYGSNNNAQIINCFVANATITSGTIAYAGRIVGSLPDYFANPINNCYASTSITVNGSTKSSQDATSKDGKDEDISSFQSQSWIASKLGWDFDTVWKMSDINSATNGLPILKNSAIPNPSPTIHVTGVTLNKTTASLAVNGTEQLTATVQPTNATNRSVTWSSSNTSIATVNTSGLVTAFAAGTATITATTADGGKTATCTVTVTEPTISVTGVTLKTATSLIVNGTEQLTATVQPTNATNKTVTWSSNNTSVATVSTSGLITALAVGTATITATTADGGKTATCTVTVAAATISVTSVTLDKTTATLTINGMEQLTATVQPTTATNQQVTWSSSNTSIATVSTSGLVTAKAVGTVTITVTTTDGGKTATCEVTVTSIASGESWNIGYPIETDVIATLSADGTTLTISGTGAMVNYNVYEAPPWYDMSSIKTVVINEGVTSIGNYAFSICNSLTSVTIPNSVTSIGDYAFGWCIGLTSVTIPNSVTSIGKDAFYRCSGLTSVTIPNSVTSIGDYAFSYCSGLTSVTIGNSVTSIGEAAFRDCIGLTSVTIPNSVTSIGKDAFYYCSGLTSVTIPNSVTSIGGAAFWYCSNLTSVTISGTGAMANYTSESSPWTFVSIKTVVINEGVTSIGNYAFSICSSLTSVTIPESVTSIGDYAFADCSGLTSVTIPNSVTSIGDYAFGRCIGLTSVTIPNSVTSIGDYAFQNCDGLTSVTCLATTPPTQGNDSFYTFNIVTLYVPASALDTYRNNSSWRSEFNIILAIESTIVPAMSVSLDKNSAALSVGDTEQLTASILPTNATNQQVTWNSSNTSVATVSENGLVTALAAGTASITVTTADGSFTATCKVTVAASGTAIETTEADKLAVYPNPARDDLFIKSDTPIEKVEIFDISGRAVETWRAASLQQGNLQTIHVSHLPNGIYLVRVACSDGSAVTKKIVVKK